MLKVGLQAFVSGGPELVRRVAKEAPVFLDLKLHDIPAQVGSSVSAVADLDVALLTVHASGGRDMLRAAVDAAGDRVTVLAVTVLTSLDEEDLKHAGIAGGAEAQVLRLAELALSADAPGLVCSPLEVAAIRARFGARSAGGPLLVVPGIRPSGSETSDQRRTLDPRAAIDAGADVIVVGRPITESSDPVAAAEAIVADIS
jgi:orotidine-5'-phosphate decarboxylase